MLLGQNCRRHQNTYLFTIHHGFKSGPEGDLCFAISDVAADKAIHGPGPFHIFFNRCQGCQLVFCLLIGEGRFQLMLPFAVRAERVAVDL